MPIERDNPANPFEAKGDGSSETLIHYYTERVKPLSELTPDDIPRGLDPEEVATDYGDTERPQPIRGS